MKLPWDKLNIAKASDKSKGVKPNPLVLDEIGQYNPSMNTNWRQIPKLMKEELKYEVKSYPDGTKYVVVSKLTSNLTFKLNTYEDLWILNQLHDVVKSAGWEVSVTIPNLIDAQADRRFGIDQPHSLKLVCNFLNGMSEFDYKIFHPHNSEVVEALVDKVEIIDNFDLIKKVLIDLKIKNYGNNAEITQDKLILMSTDAGGFKPLMKLADKLKWQGETSSASKSRVYVDGKSKLIQQVDRADFGGKDILIVDDICVYGGTFKGLAKLLRERNCGKIYLAVSHMTIVDLGEDAVTNYFDRVFTTNSKYDDYFANYHSDGGPPVRRHPENLTVINLF